MLNKDIEQGSVETDKVDVAARTDADAHQGDSTTTAATDEISQHQPAPSRERKKSRWLAKTARGLSQAILMVLILAGASYAAFQMIKAKPPTKKRPVFKTVYTIDSVVVQTADNQPVIISYGQTVAARSVDLRALVSGEIVSVSDNLRVGARVEKGAALVSIDRFNYEGALQEAEANLMESQARLTENRARINLEMAKLESLQEQLDLAQADLARAENLRQRGTSTQQQLESRRLVVSQREQAISASQNTVRVEEARLEQQKAALDRLQWKVEQARRNLESTTLTAPFAGIVRSSSAEIGRLVSANDVVVSLYEAEQLEVRFTLTDAQYGRLQTDREGLIGRAVDLSWTVGGQSYSWPAKIDRLGAEITSSRGGVEVFARVGQAQNAVVLRPGAFVEVRVPDTVFANSAVVPDTSIYGADTVYVVKDDKLVERRVTVAAFDGEDAIISTGLANGDEVLVTRITEVSEGLAVRKEGDPPANRRPTPASESESDGPAVSRAPSGRPSREEVQAILASNNLTREQFRALSQDERRALIVKHRAQTGS